MVRLNLEVGQTIWMAPVGRASGQYASRIEDLRSEGIVVGAPMEGGVPLPFPVGTRVEVEFTREDALYRFTTTVADRRWGPVPMLTLAWPATFQRVQRRELFRLPIALKVKLKAKDSGQTLEGLTVDLSGRGMGLVSDTRLPAGAEVELSFDLLPGYRIELRGYVLKVAERLRPGGNKPLYHYGIQFVGITPDIEQTLVEFIFEIQRERRRKQTGMS